MQLTVKSKNLEIKDPIRAHVEKKLGRLDRYMDSIATTEVEISMEKTKAAVDRYVVEVTMLANGSILRGEEKAADVYSAIDSVVDVMQRRLTRFKEKTQHRGRGGLTIREGQEAPVEPSAAEDAEAREARLRPHIVRTKVVSVKPMSEEEAEEQMELLGHDFFLFFNASSNRIGVLYLRHDGDYGLLEA
ncbi:MAG: ribosome hibernation-promoting factor, HPF/YfiA family, partial [Chloroflexota bacterium]